MTKSKKISNLFLALAFSCFTCGTAVVAAVPGIYAASEHEHVDVVSADVPDLNEVNRGDMTFYQISNADELAAVAFNIAKGDDAWAEANYELTDDIYLGGMVWTPIGIAGHPFKGHFNGNGHTVNGMVSTIDASGSHVVESIDTTYCGLFGHVQGACIYDFVIGSFAYAEYNADGVDSAAYSGRFIGFAEDSVLADIYDESIENNGETIRSVKTIGKMTMCQYYVGDSWFTTNYVLKSGNARQIKFDWSENDGSSMAGYSILVCADLTGNIYKCGKESEGAISYYRILVDNNGNVVDVSSMIDNSSSGGSVSGDGGLELNNYATEFAKENITADVSNGLKQGQPEMCPTTTGKKLVGWKSDDEETSATSVSDWFSVGGATTLCVKPVWKDLAYNISVYRADENKVVELTNIPYNANWADIVGKIKRDGYDLTKVYNASVNGDTTTKGLVYYTAEVEYDTSYNKTIVPTYNVGELVNHWDVAGASLVNVKIYSGWQGVPVNSTVKFQNTYDSGVKLNGVSNISIAYANGTPDGAPNLAISQTDAANGKYTFKSISDQSLKLTFKLSNGYKVRSATKGGTNGTVGSPAVDSNGVWTISLSGLLSNGDSVIIELEREETQITVTADSKTTIAISGNSEYTTLNSGVIKTRVGESFSIVATSSAGYEYKSYTHSGWGTIGSPTIADDKATFAVNITEYSSANTLTIESKEKSFVVNLVFEYEKYSDNTIKPAAVTFKAGSETMSTDASGNQTFTLVSTATLKTPSNAYYKVSNVAIIPNTISFNGSNGEYNISGITSGANITITISYSKIEYSATFNASFAIKDNVWPGVLDVNGEVLKDVSSVISFAARTYKFKDNITLTYNIVSQYYEFVGWYYANGDLISTQNNANVTAKAENMTFYGVVKGKTATATLKNGKILANYDGVADKFVNANTNVVTGSKDLSYTYTTPTHTNAAFVANAVDGYYIYKGIVHKADWAGVANNKLSGTAGTDYVLFDVAASAIAVSSQGYGDLTTNVRNFIFANPGCVIEFIGAQKAVILQFNAGKCNNGTVGNGASVSKTYYYGGADIDVSSFKDNFTCVGHTASGWKYEISDRTYTLKDENIVDNKLVFGSEILNVVLSEEYQSLSIGRTYAEITYTITLNQNTATTNGTASVKATYETTTSFAITNPAKKGYDFLGWSTEQNGGTIVVNTSGSLIANIANYTDANGKWIKADNATLYAKWSSINYEISFNANGGEITNATKTVAYAGTLGELPVPTRSGFTFAGWYYIVGNKVTQVTANTVLDSSTFSSGSFGASGGNCGVVLYAKWTFDFTLEVNKTVAVDYGTTITNQFGIKVAFNGTTKNIDSASQEIPSPLGVTSWGWTQSTTGDKIYTPAIVNAGTYTLKYTLTLTDNGSSQDLLRCSVTKSVENISYTINKVALTAYVNTMETQRNAIAANLAQLALDTQPVLKLANGDGYMAGVSGGTWSSLETYVNSLTSSSVTTEKAWFYVMTKPMMAYRFMSKSAEGFINANFYSNTALKTMTFSDYLTKYNSAANFDVAIGSGNDDYFTYSMQKYVSDSSALNIGLSGNVKTNAVVSGVTTSIPVSVVATPNDGTVGTHKLSFQIDVSSVSGFVAGNYSNITKVSDDIYTLSVSALSITDNKIAQTYIYRNPVVFTMTETTAVERISTYEFTLYYKVGETTKYTLTVKTTSGAAGEYRFADGGLEITSYNGVQLASTEFAYVDGTFTIITAPSTISFSSQTLTASTNGTGVVAQLITSPAEKPLENLSSYFITVSSISVGGNSYTITANKEVYYDTNKAFVFQIINNGSLNPTIYAATGTYTFKIAVASVNPANNRHLIELVEWTEGYDYAGLLSSKTAFPSGSYSQSIEMSVAENQEITFSAIYSEAAYVTFASAPETSFNKLTPIFANFADGVAVPTSSEYPAYVLNKWTSANGSTITNGRVALAAVPRETLTANYILATPNVAVSAVTGDAKGSISFSSIATDHLTINNNDSSIKYTYTWYKKSGTTYTAVTELANSTLSNGTYAVKVKAEKSGYSAVESGYVDFEVTFNKLTITLSANMTETTYHNTDFANAGYMITAAGGISKTYTVKDLLAESSKADKDRLFTVSLKKGSAAVTEMKTVGTYTITVSLFESTNTDNANYAKYIYESFEKSFTLEIKPYQIAYETFYNDDTKFAKYFRQEDPSLTLELTINGEKVTITYARAAGENVGVYDLTSASIANSNYVLASKDNSTTKANIGLPEGNKRFSINTIPDLQITAKANVSGTLIYNNTTPVISETAYINNLWTFTITNGAQTVTITLSDLKESRATGTVAAVPASDVATALSGLKFVFAHSTVGGAGEYYLASSWTSTNYPSGFAFDGTQPVIVIEKAKIAYDSYYTTFSKTYGADDPDLSRTLTLNNESVVIVFERNGGQKVGSYDLTMATLHNTENYLLENNEGNYVATAKLKASNKGFTISKCSALTLKFAIAEKFVKSYDGTAPTISKNATYANNKWTITVGGKVIEIDTSSFIEVELSNRQITADSTTLAGVEFELNATATVGKYTISASLPNTNKNTTYTAVELTNGDNAVEITQYVKEVAFSDLTIINNSFSKTFRAANPTTISATVSYFGTAVTLTFARTETGENVGTYALSLSDWSDKTNYAFTIPENKWFSIVKDNSSAINVTASDVTLVYSNEIPTITSKTVEGSSFKLTISNGNTVILTLANVMESLGAHSWAEGELQTILDATKFTIENAAKDKGDYAIKASLVHDNYPAGMNLSVKLHITPATVAYENYKKSFSKDYGASDPVLENTAAVGVNGETFTVIFTRISGTVDTEKVGTHNLASASTANANYSLAALPADNGLFTISTRSGLTISATITGTISHTYNNVAANSTVEATFNDTDKSYTLTVKGSDGTVWGTIKLSNFEETAEGYKKSVTAYYGYLNGISFGISCNGNVGSYSITVSGKTVNSQSTLAFANSATVVNVTKLDVELNKETFVVGKTYGDNDNLSTKITTSTNEEITINFTRYSGEAVGEYSILTAITDNGNFNLVIATGENAPVYRIAKAGSLGITVAITEKYSRSYDRTAPDKVTSSYDSVNKKWSVSVYSGSTLWKTFAIASIKENGTKDATISEKTLAGVTFSIQSASANVGNYHIVATINAAGNETYSEIAVSDGTGAIEIVPYTKVVAKADVTTSTFSKVFRDAEPSAITGTVNYLGEDVNLTFTRAKGEDVGTYDLTLNAGYNSNYSLSIPANNKWFAVTQVAGLKVKASAESKSITYTGKEITIAKVYENNAWSINILSGGVKKTSISLTSFVEAFSPEKDLTVIEATLSGIEFVLSSTAKNVGTYTISATGSNTNYPGGFEFSGTAPMITINPANLDDFTKSFEKTYGDSDPALTNEVNGVNGETVTVTFTREQGEDVASYALLTAKSSSANYVLKGGDGNYAQQVNLATNTLFTIKAYQNLKISATANKSVSLAYIGKELSLETAFENNTYVLKIKDGDTVVDTITLGLNTFKENFETAKSIAPYSTMLNGITFGFDKTTVKNVDTYNIVATGTTANYPGGFVFDGTAPTLTITKATITLAHDAAVMKKVYGAADTTIQNKVTGVNGEQVTVVYTRDTANQKVGKYAITGAEILSTETDNANNYTLSLPHNTDWFEITKPESLAISFSLKETFAKTYDAKVVTVSENATYAGGKWTITVGGKTIELENFKEGDSTSTITPDDKTLAGVSFSIVEAKNVGSYAIVATMSGENETYSSVSFDGANAVVISKLEKTLELLDLTIVDNSFTKAFRAADPTITAKANPTGNEELTLTFTREEGEDVGKYKLTGVSITAGGSAGNYTLTLPTNEWFEITAVSTAAISANATSVELVYSSQAPTVTKETEVGKLTISNGNTATITVSDFAEVITGAKTLSTEQIAEIWANTTFAIVGAKKDVGDYTITATLAHKNYPAGMTITGGTIKIKAKDITITSETPLFTKTYKEPDPSLVMTFTNGENDAIFAGDSVKVTFERTLSGDATEAVGYYALSVKSCENSNYNVKVTESNKYFQIKPLEGLFVTATISGTTNTFTYDGAKTYTITSAYVEGRGWVLTVAGYGIANAEFVLSDLHEYKSADGSTTEISNISTALEGMTFEFDREVKDVGNYTIIGKRGTNGTYTGITITNSLSVVTVVKKNVTVSAAFDKNYGVANDGELKKSYTSTDVSDIVSGDTINVEFERTEGEKVGDYNLSIVSSDNGNYNVLLDSTSKFTINKLSNLELSFTISGSYTKIYDAKAVSVSSTATYADGKWTITITDGEKTQALEITNFVEVELGNRTITADDKTLAGVVFSIKDNAKDVGSYSIVATLTGDNATYTKVNVTSENKVAIGKLTKVLSRDELTTASFTKVFRAAEPTITATANPTGNEELTLTFSRAAGENVGDYAVSLTGGFSTTNYDLSIPENTWFEITAAASSKITASADIKTFNFVYDGTEVTVSAPSYNAGNKTWSIVVSNKTESQTIVLSNFVESVTGSAVPEGEDLSTLLAGITFAFNGTAKDAATYTLSATTNGTNKNYLQGFEFVGEAPALTITKATIVIADSKDTPLFTKTYRDADPTTLSKEFDGVNGEKVTVTFTRDTTAADAERVGKHALATATTENGNYNIQLAANNSLFEIVRKAGMKLQATITGEYSKQYDATLVSISSKATYADGAFTLTIEGTEVKFTLANFTEVDGAKTYTAPVDANLLNGYTFSIENASANKGTYTIVVSGSDDTYEGLVFVSAATVEITAREVELTAGNFAIGKIYGDSDVLTKSVATEWGTFNATIIRASGEKVGEYVIESVTSDNTNFAPYLSSDNASKYVITRREPLTLSFALKQVYTKTYDAKAVSIGSTANYADGKWTITLDETTYELVDFKEVELSGRAAPVDEDTLKNVTFSLSAEAKDVNSYNIVASIAEGGNKTYTAISFTGGEKAVVISKCEKELALSDLSETTFTKVFRATESAITAKANPTGNEALTLTFTRTSGENVGKYALTGVSITAGGNAGNYNLNVPAVNDWFEITKNSASAITATADVESFGFTYDASVPAVSAPVYNAANKTWSVVVSNKAETKTIVLSNFVETVGNGYVLTDDDYANLLNGILFKLVKASDAQVDAVADAGEYKLVAVGGNDNYPAGFAFVDSKNPVLTIAPATITITDGEPIFVKTYRDADPTLTAEYDGVSGEKVTVTFTRDTTAADAERVGKHALATATTENGNYNIRLTTPNKLFRIDRREGLNIQATVIGTVFAREYNGNAPDSAVAISDNKDGTFTLTITDGAQTAVFTLKDFIEIGGGLDNRNATYFEGMLEGISFSIANAGKNVGKYSITAEGSTNTYGALIFKGDVKVMEITKAVITLEESKTQFSKIYGDEDPDLSLTLSHSDYTKIVDGETVNVTLSRESGENIGSYALKNAETANTNYSISLGENKWFTITKRANLVLRATLTGKRIEKVYNGFVPTIEFNVNGTITVKDSEMIWGTFTLTDLTEYAAAVGDGDAFEREISLGANTFSGLTFKIDGVSKNSGSYSIVTDGIWGHNTYTTFEFVDESNKNAILITPYDIVLAKDETAFTKTYGDANTKISNEVNGVGSEKITVVYTREEGEDVGTYNIVTATIENEVDNKNYTLTLLENNDWFTIKAFIGLKLSAKASLDKVEFVYANAVPTISQQVFNNKLELTITLGGKSQKIELTDLVELFETPKNVVDIAHAYENITFSIKNVSKNANESGYEIIAECTNRNYPSGFVFADNTIPVVVISKSTIALTKQNSSFSKIYNVTDEDSFPNGLVKTYPGQNGEVVTVTFERAEGEDVKTYKLTIKDVSSDNYEIVLPEDNDWFEILVQDGLGITAEVEGDKLIMDYAGIRNLVVETIYKENTWYLTVREGTTQLASWALKNFKEVKDEASRDISPKANTLANITFDVDRIVKNKGTYTIVPSGTNNTYPTGFSFAGNNQLIEVRAKELTLANISKQFDQTTTFDSTLDKNNVEIVGLVSGENIIVKGQFANIGVGENISINNVEILGEDVDNYTFSDLGLVGSIIKSDIKPVIAVNKTDYTYGELSRGLNDVVVSATINGQPVETYISTVASIDGATYSTGGYLDKGTYVLKITTSSDYYTVEDYSATITVLELEISVYVDGEITKVYDRNTTVKQTLSLENVLANDAVTVSGAYVAADPGAAIEVAFTLAGDDKDNYTLTNATVIGIIERAIITVTAQNNTIDFVDGILAAGTDSFAVGFPFESDGETVYASLTEPTKTGYRFSGWQYGEDKATLTADNIVDVFDGALDDKQLTIYAAWEINTYTVRVNINEEQGSYTADPVGTRQGNVHTYNYYETITITAVPKVGFVALNNSQQIVNIAEDTNISVDFRSATITFNVSVDKSSLYPYGNAEITFGGEWTVASDGVSVSRVISYAALENIVAAEFLPTVDVTGYNLINWKSGEKTVATGSTETLEELILAINSTFTDDIALNFTTSFEAKQYKISFIAYGSGEEPASIDVTYGEAIGTLPEVTNDGFNFGGWKYQGETYTADTIFALDEDITLIALWTSGVFDLTVTATHATVSIKNSSSNEAVALDGGVYKLNYSVNYTITVTAEAGYKVTALSATEGTCQFSYALGGDNAVGQISEMISSCEITVSTEEKDNTFTVVVDHASINVTVGGDKTLEDATPEIGSDGLSRPITFTAKTARTVVLEVVPENGYDIVLKSVSGADVVNDDNVYTFTGFISDVSIEFESVAQQHIVTFVLGAGVAGIGEYHGAEKQSQETFVVTTDVVFSFALAFDYGYEYDKVETNPTLVVNVGELIEITGFTDDFTITVVAKKSTFDVTTLLFALDQEGNVKSTASFSVTAPNRAEYLSTIEFVASKDSSVQGYKFIGWFEGELVEEDGKVVYDINDITSEALTYERVVDKAITLTAVFQYAEFIVKASVECEGQINIGDRIVADSETGAYFNETVYYGTNLTLSAVPKAGYQFAYWLEDSVRKDSLPAEFSCMIEKNIEYVAVFEPLRLTFQVSAAVSINGVKYTEAEYINELGFGSMDWGTYEDGAFTADSNSDGNIPLTVQALSGKKVYIRIIARTGYTFDAPHNNEGAVPLTVNSISGPTEVEGGLEYIYEIDGLNSDNTGRYGLTALFIAKSTCVTVLFKEIGSEALIDAGRIEVAVSAGVEVSGNSNSQVVVDVVTGKTLNITASTRFGVSFDLDENSEVKIEAVGLTLSDVSAVENTEDLIKKKGFDERITFKVSGFTGDTAEIIIYVKSAVYTVELVDFDDENNKIYSKTISGVKTGQLLDLTGIDMPSKVGSSFAGFYTYLAGAGTQYIDKNGTPTIWSETGYSWNGTEYVQDPNYNKETKQFTLYASFIINKTKVTIDAIPPALKGMDPTVAARVVITSINEANSWTTQDDIFMAEILYGATINIEAPVYEGYRFAYWKIVRTDSNGTETTDISTEGNITNLPHDNCPRLQLYAVYDVLISISKEVNGGRIYFTYTDRDGNDHDVGDHAYVPATSDIVLHAEPDNGYNFLGWFDENDDLLADSSQRVVIIKSTETNLLLTASYKALFAGKNVTISIGNYEATRGRIYEIQVDGQSIGAESTVFIANIGSKVTIYLEKFSDNFELVFEGAEVIYMGDDQYVYTVAYRDINPETYALTLTPVFTQLTCDVQINVKLITDDEGNNNELPLAGVVRYFDAEGNKIAVVGATVTFNDRVGREITLEIIPNINYKIASIMHGDQNVTEQIVAGRIALSIKYIHSPITSEGGMNVINIAFQRDLWTDLVNEEYQINGEGTRGNPYLISSEADLAFVSYMVNILGNKNFANATYKLIAQLNLAGKYWSPIGTEENPFNGTFDFDVFTIEGVSVIFGYTGDLDTTKVFGYLGPDAKFAEANQELMIILIVVGAVVGLTMMAIVIFLVLRRKRRKKIEELQNS